MKKLIIINVLLFVVFLGVYTINSNLGKYIFNTNKLLLLADNNNFFEVSSNKDDKINQKTGLDSNSAIQIEDYGALYNDVVKMIQTTYVEDVDENEFFEASLNGMLTSLDPHSAYFSAEEYEQLVNDTQGEFSGLGIEVTVENSFVKVVTPIDDGPAYKAGIKSGDYISEIDGKSVINMTLNEAVKMMRGKNKKDKGTVKLTILRSGEKEPLEFKIKRDVIKTDSVKARAEGDIIYLRIASFTGQTYTNMIKEFNKVENEIGKENVKGLVLDLRNNPGGLLDASVFVSDAFLDKGQKIVSIKGKNGILMKEYKAMNDQDLIPGLPMVVLINEGSASASEIVAGALQDNGRAIILGKQSFGKGSVQSIIPLTNGGGIKLTIAKYYTPNDISIQAEGIKPDIEVGLAKLETIDTSKWTTKENDLKGHLENEDKVEDDIVHKEIKKQLKTNNESMYNKDYQLARALDLLLGINFYNQNNKAK